METPVVLIEDALLSKYLADHQAGSVAGVELSKKLAEQTKGDPDGDYLRKLWTQIQDDQNQLEGIMNQIGAEPDPLKMAGAKAAAQFGTALTGGGASSSGTRLNLLRELEALTMGVKGKQCLWLTLERIAPSDARLSDVDFRALADRAQGQMDLLDEFRNKVSTTAFA
jgi:hypothetical protein